MVGSQHHLADSQSEIKDRPAPSSSDPAAHPIIRSMAKIALTLATLFALSLLGSGCATPRQAALSSSAVAIPPGPPPMEYALADRPDSTLLSQLALP